MADMETPNWINAALSALGISSGGVIAAVIRGSNKLSEHDTKIERLQKDQEKDSVAIKTTNDTVIRLDERSKKTAGEVTTILELLRQKR